MIDNTAGDHTVVEIGVVHNLVDVGKELLAALVALLSQVVSDGLQVHGP